MLKVSWIAVKNWLSRFEANGVEGLREQPRSGRKTHLARADEEAFKIAVETLQAQREGGRIRGQDIQQLLKETFNAHYELDGVYALLKRLNMSWITACSMHAQADRWLSRHLKKLC